MKLSLVSIKFRCTLFSLAGGLFLAGCGSSGSPPDIPPVVNLPPVIPAEPAMVLLAENLSGYFFPGGIAVDQTGTIYVGNNARHTIHKVATDGTVTFVAGNSAVSVEMDGIGDKAGLGQIDQLLIDKRSQSLYALTRGNSTYEPTGLVRRVSPAGDVKTLSLAPIPTHKAETYGQAGDRAASLAFGADNMLYAATMRSSQPLFSSGGPHISYSSYRFLNWRTVEEDGKGRSLFEQEIFASKFGGVPDESYPDYQYPADAGATGGVLGAMLLGLAVDRAGNAYVADSDRQVIVKVTPAGAATIHAGTVKTTGTTDGDGKIARFNNPTALVIDKADNLYVLDRGNATVRKITPAGTVTTVVGVAGQTKTAVGNLPGGLGDPKGLALDENGRLYITVDKGIVRARLP